ncbi:serine/threonine-protein kinase [Microbispora catharanthi]|uniref:Protein kinase n=1 Tax=Microbispora catharanthi TaxID=1712871 RepID=A0A5N6C1F3_9ACTN|nr:serine/threonine-protein kinase [Microbispora catharanthi]KAB8186596.1 protein kinase [Microbispora catharanthi]
MPDVSPLRPEDPHRLGNYRLDGRLGVGGQGVVFRGAGASGGPVAVKLLHARVDDASARRAFAREIEAVRRVAPFCTAQVLDADLDGDRPYIVSEYVDGPSLREHVTAAGPRTGGDLDRVAVGTATALAAIHRAGVVHRDFKPGNVLLGSDGLRVVDFGISRLADATATTGNPVGTPAYIAPEQLEGRPAGPAADVFCWALTLVYAASGRHAYTGDTYAAVMARILYGTPDLGPLTGLLKDLVVACLAAEPADRPDAGQVLSALLDRSPGRPGPAAQGLPARDLTAQGPTTLDPSASGSAAGPRREPEDTLPGAWTDADRADAEPTEPERRRGRARVVALVASLAVLVAVGVAWVLTAREPGRLDGTWTGVARYPSAGRVFPVEIRLAAPARMRWGADLHCSGRLTPASGPGDVLVLALDQVKGDACYPGSVSITWRGESAADFEVTRAGEQDARYSGSLTRTN